MKHSLQNKFHKPYIIILVELFCVILFTNGFSDKICIRKENFIMNSLNKGRTTYTQVVLYTLFRQWR